MLTLGLLIGSAPAKAAGNDNRLSVLVDCHCSDVVGGEFCSALKDKVKDSTAYRLVDHADAYGIGVHLWCVDLFTGIPGVATKLTGTMSAVSVAFTIYSDRLPGEVADEMSDKILAAVGQLATANKAVFEHMRIPPKAAATPTQQIIQ
jgi:hypothetical protein